MRLSLRKIIPNKSEGYLPKWAASDDHQKSGADQAPGKSV